MNRAQEYDKQVPQWHADLRPRVRFHRKEGILSSAILHAPGTARMKSQLLYIQYVNADTHTTRWLAQTSSVVCAIFRISSHDHPKSLQRCLMAMNSDLSLYTMLTMNNYH